MSAAVESSIRIENLS